MDETRRPPWQKPRRTWRRRLVVTVAAVFGGFLVLGIIGDLTKTGAKTKTGELGPALRGHTDQINSVAFGPAGRTIASASNDGTIRLWDVGSHKRLGRPLEARGYIKGVAFSPDGHLLASGSDDGTVRLWDVKTHRQIGRPLARLSEPNFNVDNPGFFGVAFSPDGKTLAAGAENDTVWLWDVGTRRLLGRLSGPAHSVESVAFSPDGRILASGSDDRTIRFWDVRSRRPLGPRLRGHSDEVWSVAFSPDGRILASGSADGVIRLWDVRHQRQLGAPLRGHTNSVHSVAFSPNGWLLASGSYDDTIRLWDIRSHKQFVGPLRDPSSVRAVAFSPNGAILASGDSGSGGTPSAVRLWNIAQIVKSTKH
jgi:WD40 repeat protein